MFQIEQKYEILSSNDKGTFFKAKQKKDEREVAIKKICFANMNEKDKKHITDQVNLLRSIKRNNNIVRYYDYIIDKTTANLFISMEYCSGESIEQFLKLNREKGTYIEEKVIWRIFSQIVNAVYQIHNYPQGPIMHRDIKPKAILLDKQNNIKLGNFNLLRKLDAEEQFSKTYISGTYYKSPQQIKQRIYGTQSDIWALGCLLYEMTTLRSPFKKNSQYLTDQSIINDKVQEFPKNSKIPQYSQELKRVINWCLEKQLLNRPTVAHLKSVPQINLLIKKARLSVEIRRTQQKQEEIKKKQQMLKKMQAKIKQLQSLSMKEEEKQNYQLENLVKNKNYQLENWVKNSSSSLKFNYKS